MGQRGADESCLWRRAGREAALFHLRTLHSFIRMDVSALPCGVLINTSIPLRNGTSVAWFPSIAWQGSIQPGTGCSWSCGLRAKRGQSTVVAAPSLPAPQDCYGLGGCEGRSPSPFQRNLPNKSGRSCRFDSGCFPGESCCEECCGI